jgi:hypothetical protein
MHYVMMIEWWGVQIIMAIHTGGPLPGSLRHPERRGAAFLRKKNPLCGPQTVRKGLPQHQGQGLQNVSRPWYEQLDRHGHGRYRVLGQASGQLADPYYDNATISARGLYGQI